MSTANNQYTSSKEEYAEVISVHHPLIITQGFSDINTGEVVLFEDDSLGQVLSYTETKQKIMVFSNTPPKLGSKIFRTGSQLTFPVHENLLGNVYNPLGSKLLSANKAKTPKKVTYKEIFTHPPSITERTRITKQLISGFSITDLLLPIGKGQRELLIGDKKSGKSNFARNLAVKQAQEGSIVVFALIGKQVAQIKNTFDFFTQKKVIDNIVLIASTPKDPISSIIISPYAAMTVAEYFASTGKDVLLLLDDLTTQAEYYREVSLLAKKFPGRDSYPGDIFFSQAQLLERGGSFQHPDAEDGVSITCLPVVRTSNSDLTDFIASNLISITDGHLLFDTKLFNQGVRPAVNLGLSVTRVGKQTQTQLQRDVNVKVTSFLSQYKKTKNLTHIGSEISEASQRVLHKGTLLTKFFSEENGLQLPVQLILLSMIWLGWFEKTHEKVIDNCKIQLESTYTVSTSQSKINGIVGTAKTFDELQAAVEKEKSYLLGICQI